MSTRIKQSRADVIFDLINYTILTLILLIVAYPLVYVVSASISDPLAAMQGRVWLWPVDVTFDAYRRVFQNGDILTGYRNTFIYTIVGTCVNLIMTVMGAYPLSRKDFYGRNFITIMFTFTMFFSGGLIPTYILVSQKLHLYNNFWVMILPGAVGMWNMVIMRTFFQNTVPMELQEAAFIDGCSNLGTLVKIVLPLSKPIIAVMVMFYGVGHWNEYFNGLIYLSTKEKFPLQLILREILIRDDMAEMIGSDDSLVRQQLIAESIKYSVIVVASLPVLCLYPFLQKYFIHGVMVGAIKG